MFRRILNAEPPWIIGVVNVTPDSFSDGGTFLEPQAAVSHARQLRSDGAHLIELGAQSTAPGSNPISPQQEMERLKPVLDALDRCMPISVDTYDSKVAHECLAGGAIAINDISGLRADPELAAVISQHRAGIFIMHSKEQPHAPHASWSEKKYKDIVSEIADFLMKQTQFAIEAGIAADHIALDPGMGRFISHDAAVSWELLRKFGELCELLKPYPVMVATSRKGFLGGALNDREIPSLLTAMHAVQNGAQFIRTHNVRLTRQALDTLNALSQLK